MKNQIVINFLLFICCFSSYSQEYEVELNESKNVYFSQKIDSMMVLDQAIRKNKYNKLYRTYRRYQNDSTKNKSDKKYLKSLKYIKKWDDIDSSNYTKMLELIAEFGFPGKEKVGSQSYFNSYVMFLHYVMMPNYGELQIILDSALNKNKISPHFYADVTDRHRYNNGKTPLYYMRGYCDYPTLSKEKKKIISDNRKSIGLKPMKAKCGTFRKSFIIE